VTCGIGGQFFKKGFGGRHVGLGDDEAFLVGTAGKYPQQAAEGERDDGFSFDHGHPLMDDEVEKLRS
jgi:hypothetical protein